MEAGMTITPRPLPNDPGHCEIEEITIHSKKEDRVRTFMQALAKSLIQAVEGPFH